MTRARFAALTFAATLAGCAATQSGVGLPQTGTQALGQAANATTQAGALATPAREPWPRLLVRQSRTPA